jgi:uncharacterized Fe-S cluster-containing protein
MRTYTQKEQKVLMLTLGDYENSQMLSDWLDEWENEILLSDLPEGQYCREFTFEVLIQYLNDMFDDVESLIEETLAENLVD